MGYLTCYTQFHFIIFLCIDLSKEKPVDQKHILSSHPQCCYFIFFFFWKKLLGGKNSFWSTLNKKSELQWVEQKMTASSVWSHKFCEDLPRKWESAKSQQQDAMGKTLRSNMCNFPEWCCDSFSIDLVLNWKNLISPRERDFATFQKN